MQGAAGRLRANGNVHIGLWQNACTALRPLDQAQGIALEVVAYPQVLQFLRVDQPIQVEMKHANRVDLVWLDQGEGRALDRPGMTQAANDPARQGGFPRPQIAMQIDHPTPATDL